MNRFEEKQLAYGREKYPTFTPKGMSREKLVGRLKNADEGACAGLWRQGLTSHDTIQDANNRDVASFKHADTAAFVDMLVNAWRSGRLEVTEAK